MRVAIVGLGLMGGSFGLALKEAFSDIYLLGIDQNENHTEEALRLGLVDEIIDFSQIEESDVIVLAIPVEGIIASLKQLSHIPKETTVIDLGSTKEKIVQEVPHEIRSNLVAAHPMAGKEKFGPSAASGDLFAGQTVVLCDTHESDPFHLSRVRDIFEKIGMKIVYMQAKEHDLHAAYISHLPHAISYALANTVLKQENPSSILALAAGGFKDMSRIAKSSPHMWTDVFKQNRENLLTTIDGFESEMSLVKKLVQEERWEELAAWMQEATTLHKIL